MATDITLKKGIHSRNNDRKRILYDRNGKIQKLALPLQLLSGMALWFSLVTSESSCWHATAFTFNSRPDFRSCTPYSHEIFKGNGQSLAMGWQQSQKQCLQRLERKTNSQLRSQPDDVDNDILSDTDAKVLRSLLNDNVDLTTEDRMKKMLQRDESAKQEKARQAYEASQNNSTAGTSKEENFSSQIFQNFSDDSFWNSLRAKTNSFIESAQLFVQNRIERDAQLVAALGLFAFDRIQKDIARALPSTSSAGSTFNKKRTLTLESKSSFLEVDASISERQKDMNANQKRRRELYQEFNTPADELRQVSESIKAIFSGESTYSYAAASSIKNRKFNISSIEEDLNSDASISNRNSASNLRSVAPAGSQSNRERQNRALQKKKLLFEKEQASNPQKVARSISDLSGTAYQIGKEIKTEIQVEEPGYKTEKVRRALGEGTRNVQGFLEESGTRIWGSLKGSIQENNLLNAQERSEEPSFTGTPLMENMNEMDNIIMETSASEIEEVYQEEIIEQSPQIVITPQMLQTEKMRLIESIQSCLDNPSQTWLRKDQVSASSSYLADLKVNNIALGEAITAMVTAVEDLMVTPEFVESITEEVQNELVQEWRDIVDDLCFRAELAAGVDAANIFKECLLMDSLLLNEIEEPPFVPMEEINSEENTEVFDTFQMDMIDVVTPIPMTDDIDDNSFVPESTITSPDATYVDVETTQGDTSASPFTFTANENESTIINSNSVESEELEIPVMDVIDLDVEVDVDTRQQISTNKDFDTIDMDSIDSEEALTIEIVGDDEEIMVEIQAESISPTDNDEDGIDENGKKKEEKEEESVLVDVTLRSLDVAFFLAEKAITVSCFNFIVLIYVWVLKLMCSFFPRNRWVFQGQLKLVKDSLID